MTCVLVLVLPSLVLVEKEVGQVCRVSLKL